MLNISYFGDTLARLCTTQNRSYFLNSITEDNKEITMRATNRFCFPFAIKNKHESLQISDATFLGGIIDKKKMCLFSFTVCKNAFLMRKLLSFLRPCDHKKIDCCSIMCCDVLCSALLSCQSMLNLKLLLSTMRETNENGEKNG